MSAPNPFMYGGAGPPVADNPFGDSSGGQANPYMAQQAQQMGYGGYNQFGQMQPDPSNPYAAYGGMGMQQAGMMGYGQYGQQQQYNQFGQPMAQVNPNPAAPNPGAALFGGPDTATNPGAALFGSPAPQMPPVPPRRAPMGAPEANPFADMAQTPHQVGSPHNSGTPGTSTPGSVVTQAKPEANPFADMVSLPPAQVATPVQAATPPLASATATPASNAEVNPFADVSAAEEVKASSPEAANPFADEPTPKQPVQETTESAPETSPSSKAAVMEMVGGLETEMDRMEIAKTPTVPNIDEPESSDTESESESVQEKEETVTKTEESNVVDSKESELEEKAAIESKSNEESDSESSGPTSRRESSGGQTGGFMTGGTGAGLFDDAGPGAPPPPPRAAKVGGTGAALFGETELEPPKLSTGDAIFSDMPTADIKSTGAAIFGLSDQGAAGSTGAAIFDIQAPSASQPCHGEMSGWDDAFDQKFDVASAPLNPNSAIDAFGGGVNAAQNQFGYGAPEPAFGDAFGLAPMEADMNNPFKAEEAGFPGPGKKKKNPDGTTPETPLFDDDTSRPLEPFPRIHKEVDGWEMFIRHPPKKKITAQRFWKKIWVKISKGDAPAVLLYNHKDDKEPFQELPLQTAYSLSDISHQIFDQYQKIFTVKLQYIFYKERAGLRPGQITKLSKLTDKIGLFAKAVEDADLKGVKTFASDMKKLGVPLEHAPQISELLKLASINYEDMVQFSVCIEEKLFRITDLPPPRSLTYKTEEVQMTAVDEVYVEQDNAGHILKQICRVRVFCLCFLSGTPQVDLGVNDMTRMGLEVVGRHDILPIPTDQWIRYEDIEFHSIVDQAAFETEDHVVKFKPPDACYVEVMRFRTRPPRARELPMGARCSFQIVGSRVEIRADVMVPYQATKAWGQVPCEDVALRIPIPEAWIYQFRKEQLNVGLSAIRGALSTGNINLGTRHGAVKSSHRRVGKVKGMDRFMGTVETADKDLMETSSGEAKYEHQHKSIVWRVPRLPKHGQGSYTTHEFLCRFVLTDYDKERMPEMSTFEKHFYLEFTQPATSESYTVLRSVSIIDGSGEPPEKAVKYIARHEYKIGIKFIDTAEQDSYRAATAAVKPDPAPPVDEGKMTEYEDFPDENGRKDSDSDSD